MVGNYSRTQSKYSYDCFNILDNSIRSKKQKTIQYTPVLYGTLILSLKVKYLQEVVK